MSTFATQIKAMHQMYSLDINSVPTTESSDGRSLNKRLETFYSILAEEVNEIDDINIAGSEGLDALVEIADLLGDVVVYCHSEALKYGIPIFEVLNIIMESNLSKLGADGQPIKDARGKVLKGPNFFPPEPKIRELLSAKMAAATEPDPSVQSPSTTIA